MPLSARIHVALLVAIVTSVAIFSAWLMLRPAERTDAIDVCAGMVLGEDAGELCVPVPL